MEALRGGGLQAQKENVDVVFVGGSKSGLGLKGARALAELYGRRGEPSAAGRLSNQPTRPRSRRQALVR